MKYLVISLTFFVCSCGVKGKPQPPLEPVKLGHGEPTYSSTVKKITIEKTKKKDDWDDESDFSDEGQK